MAKKRKGSGSAYAINETQRQLPEEGLHKARPYRFIELGTQESEEWGDKFKVQVSYELVEHSAVFNEEKGEQNFTAHRKYNKSLHKRSDLGKDVRAIMGKDFPEKGEFEMDEILDRPCFVEIQHSEDGQYANVVKVISAKQSDLKGFPKLENDCVSLYLDDNFDEDVFEELHEGIREKIEESPEYQEMFPDAKPKRKGSRKDDDDEEEEDEDDRPRRKSSRRDEEDEEEEDEDDDRPRRKTNRREKPSRKVAPKKKARSRR